MVFVGLPGTWVIFLSAAFYALFYSFEGGASSAWILGSLLAIACVGELMEFYVGTFGSKTLKVSTGAVVAAFLGGVLGMILGAPIFIVGSLLGLLLGAFFGAFFYEGLILKNWRRAFYAASAVLATRLVAIGLKSLVALGMGLFLFFKMF